jgi:uncharacterized protein
MTNVYSFINQINSRGLLSSAFSLKKRRLLLHPSTKSSVIMNVRKNKGVNEMCFWKKWFGKKERKQEVPVEEVKTEQPIKEAPEEIKEVETIVSQNAAIEPKTTDAVLVVEKVASPTNVKEQPIVEETSKTQEPEEAVNNRYAGKYEVFPEAGLFKYRLKASNGEILVVSGGYTTKNGAINGIETLKKNIETGRFDLVTDKNDFSQFQLYTPNGSRLVVSGEFYESLKRAESAMESLKKFAGTDKIVELDAIPLTEVREEVVASSNVEKKPNGKIELSKEDDGFHAVLKASNGEILFNTTSYASKASLLQGIESIKKAVESGAFRVSKDKQNRYQFKLYGGNNQILLSGETYSTKDSAVSVVDSVKRFLFDAKVIE